MTTPATTNATASEALASHFVGLTTAGLPASLLAQARTLVLDYLGVAVAGSQSESGRIAARFATDTGGRPESTVFGQPQRVPAVHAALANAISSHSLELDDVDVLALFHFSPPVVSAALAVAEREQATGDAFLTAVAAGCEMMARASAATNPSLRDRGYHTTPVCGVFGAAVAAGRLIGLGHDAMVSALGLAGAQASGLMEMYGPSMHKRFNPGPAARNGVTAAVMAQMGFTGAATIFDGERGFCRAFSDGFDLDALTRGLGTDFPVFMEFKPYSSARPIHNAIDCALAVRRELGDAVSRIRAITMRRHPGWAKYHLNARPRTYHEAQVSLPFSTAVALVEGAALLPQYQDDRLANPEIVRLASLVRVVTDETLPRGVSCLMTVETDDGRVARAQVDHPRGSIVNPMTEDEMHAKVHMLADPVIGQQSASAMIDAVARIEDLEHIGDLTKLLTFPTTWTS